MLVFADVGHSSIAILTDEGLLELSEEPVVGHGESSPSNDVQLLHVLARNMMAYAFHAIALVWTELFYDGRQPRDG